MLIAMSTVFITRVICQFTLWFWLYSLSHAQPFFLLQLRTDLLERSFLFSNDRRKVGEMSGFTMVFACLRAGFEGCMISKMFHFATKSRMTNPILRGVVSGDRTRSSRMKVLPVAVSTPFVFEDLNAQHFPHFATISSTAFCVEIDTEDCDDWLHQNAQESWNVVTRSWRTNIVHHFFSDTPQHSALLLTRKSSPCPNTVPYNDMENNLELLYSTIRWIELCTVLCSSIRTTGTSYVLDLQVRSPQVWHMIHWA